MTNKDSSDRGTTPARRSIVGLLLIGGILSAAGARARADQVEMQNGDRYLGKILSLDTNTVVMESDVLGTVRLPRAKTVAISVGSTTETNAVRILPPPVVAPAPLTNAAIDLSASLRQLGGNTNFIQQIQAQILGAAGPEANGKFNELVGGLMSGKLTVNDIRAEAKSAVQQVKDLKRSLGDSSGEDLDGYLAILEGFLQETAPASAASPTNVTVPVLKPKPAPAARP